MQIEDARLEPGQAQGAVASGGHTITWHLTFSGAAQPLFLLPLNLYQSAFPRAKSLVGLPMVDALHDTARAALPGPGDSFNALWQTVRAQASFSYFDWHFRSETERVCLEGRISAPGEAFVGLSYRNPPGGVKQCLNTKIAACELAVTHRQAGRPSATEVLSTRHRAAFEILTDDRDHGVEILV
jgi:hypothetical protein